MRNLFIIMTAILITLPQLAVAEKKIGFVNPRQAISQSEEVQASQLEMKSDMGDERAKLQKLQKEIQQIDQKLQKENMTLSDKQKKNLQDKRESKMIEARQLSKLVQKRMKGEQQQIVKKMRPKVMEAVKEIANNQGYDVVLNVQAVMYADEGMDITQQVIKKLNEAE